MKKMKPNKNIITIEFDLSQIDNKEMFALKLLQTVSYSVKNLSTNYYPLFNCMCSNQKVRILIADRLLDENKSLSFDLLYSNLAETFPLEQVMNLHQKYNNNSYIIIILGLDCCLNKKI